MASKNSKKNFDTFLERVQKALSTCQDQILKSYETLRFHQKMLKKEVREEKRLKKRIKDLETARTLIQKLAQDIQTKTHLQIASVVSTCLETVYANHPDGPYQFRLNFLSKRNKTEAELVFRRNGHEIDPMEEGGGGPLDIGSFALRLACILSSKPALSKTVILDEPFRNVQPSLRPTAAQLLMELSKKTGVQFIVITHYSEVKNVGKVITIK